MVVTGNSSRVTYDEDGRTEAAARARVEVGEEAEEEAAAAAAPAAAGWWVGGRCRLPPAKRPPAWRTGGMVRQRAGGREGSIRNMPRLLEMSF